VVIARLLPPEADPSQALLGILRTLTSRVEGARGAAIADGDGLPIARYAQDGRDLATATAMSALITRAATTVFEGLGLKEFDFATFEGSGVKLLVFSIRNSASLILLTDDAADRGEAELQAHWAVNEIASLLNL
jgi:predicted regulator of Ras-like GTPase activity (Roadblock/LC7/MglB family)